MQKFHGKIQYHSSVQSRHIPDLILGITFNTYAKEMRGYMEFKQC